MGGKQVTGTSQSAIGDIAAHDEESVHLGIGGDDALHSIGHITGGGDTAVSVSILMPNSSQALARP